MPFAVGLAVPFDDEVAAVVLVASDPGWAAEFAALAAQLRSLNLADAGAIDHVGSTSIPGLDAKDVIDVQVRLTGIETVSLVESFDAIGFRRRPEPWNNVETTRSGPSRKLVFASPVGARRSNVHVRVDGTAGATDALLFRDYLRSQPAARDAWSRFKHAVVLLDDEVDLATYGQIKQPAWGVLMRAADRWATANDWKAPRIGPW